LRVSSGFERIASQVREIASGRYADELIASLRPSVRITCVEPEGDLRIGRSRFGGWPDVPPSFEWPTCVGLSNPRWWREFYQSQHEDRLTDETMICGGLQTLGELVNSPMYGEPKPLTLLAQINLAELPRDVELDLPDRGQLLFFCDMGDELVSGGACEPHDRWRVYYIDVPSGALVRMPRPTDNLDDPPVVRALRFAPEWTVDESLRDRSADESTESFRRVREALIGGWGAQHHRLLGHPQPIQSAHLGYGAELTLRQLGYDEALSEADAEQANRVWRSLLQLDGDDELRWSWGDGGRLHFVVREDDLSARRFDRVMVELQCH
jgi:uncharacterized protein YwqG